jgi:hypothetical protein
VGVLLFFGVGGACCLLIVEGVFFFFLPATVQVYLSTPGTLAGVSLFVALGLCLFLERGLSLLFCGPTWQPRGVHLPVWLLESFFCTQWGGSLLVGLLFLRGALCNLLSLLTFQCVWELSFYGVVGGG